MKKSIFCLLLLVVGILVFGNSNAFAKNRKHITLQQLNARYEKTQSELDDTQRLIAFNTFNAIEDMKLGLDVADETMNIEQLQQYELHLKAQMRILEKRIEYRKIQNKINAEARKQKPSAKKIIEFCQQRDQKVTEINALIENTKPNVATKAKAGQNITNNKEQLIPLSALEPDNSQQNSNNDIGANAEAPKMSFDELAHPNGTTPVLTVRGDTQAAGKSTPAPAQGCTSVCSVVINSLKNPILHFGYGIVSANGTALHVAGGGPIFVQPLHGKFVFTEFLAVGRVWGHGLNLAYAQYGGGPGVVLKGTVINPAFGATRLNLPDHSISSKASFFLNVLHGPVLAQYVYVPATHTHIVKANVAVNLSSILKAFK